MATKPRTPRRTPQRTPRPKRVDARPTLTIKGPEITPEFRGLMNRAASDAGLTQAELVVQAVTREAQRILKGEAEAAAGPPPAVVQEELVQTTVERVLAALDAREAQRRGFMGRFLRGLLGGRS